MELLTELHVIFGQINLQSIMMGALWKSVKCMAYFMGIRRGCLDIPREKR